MPSYRIAGVDKETGFHTRIFVGADSPDEAMMAALEKDIVNPRIEQVIATTPASAPQSSARSHPPTQAATSGSRARRAGRDAGRVWRELSITIKVAIGVFIGLFAFSVFTCVGVGVLAEIGRQGALSSPGRSTQQRSDLQHLTLDHLGYRIVESNSSWTRYAWKADITNASERSIIVRLTIQFLDPEGFEIDRDTARNVKLRPGSNSVSEVILVSSPRRGEIATAKCFVEL